MPNQENRRVSKILWSMVSKAADRSRRQRQEIFCERVALIRWSCMHRRAVSVEWCLVSRLVGINQVVRCKVIRETRFNDTFYYFWYKREVGNWSLSKVGFLRRGDMTDSLRLVEVTRAKWQINYVNGSRNQECRAFFEKPGRNRIGITLFVGTVE